MNKKVIIITQDLSELPFDIKSYRANEYSMQFHKTDQLIKRLEELLAGAIEGTTQFGNPVWDYSTNFKEFFSTPSLKLDDTSNTPVLSASRQTDLNISIDDTPCIFDNIVEAEETIKEIGEMTIGIADDMKIMGIEVEHATNEINRVKQTGGSNVITFARNISRKVSTPISKFADKLNDYNMQTDIKWSSIENNLLQYFDSNPKSLKDNLRDTDTFYDSIETLYSSFDTSSKSMSSFMQALQGAKGFERRLNAATNRLESSVNDYLNLIEKMKSSIDRILSKIDTLEIKLKED